DIYALGGVLHFMLTAHIPFDRDSDEAKLWAHLSEPPPLPSRLREGLPVEFDAVVARAMAKDPGERQPSAGDLRRAAQAAAHGEARAGRGRGAARAPASPDGAELTDELSTLTRLQQAPPAARSRRAPLIAAAVAAVAAVGILLLAKPFSSGDDGGA